MLIDKHTYTHTQIYTQTHTYIPIFTYAYIRTHYEILVYKSDMNNTVCKHLFMRSHLSLETMKYFKVRQQ